jgi:glutaredoxin
MKSLAAPRILLVFLALFVSAATSCNREQGEKTEPVGAAPKSNELPPLELSDETPNLLLTWIDDKGDFHVVQKPGDVPEANRSKVRVVVTTREDGTKELVYVADLSRKNPDGHYTVATMSRSQWDELGAAKRSARLEALAPSALPSASSGAPPVASAIAGDKVVAIVYGAEWCRPCHDAARYLKQRGVKVVEKDIEASQAAASELRTKLDRANMSGASIPIIDVMGRLLVGFSPRALDRAIEAARNTKTL